MLNPEGNLSSATLLAQNAKAPLIIQWSDGQTDSTAVNLPGGDYTVTVTDKFLCTDTVSFKVIPEVFEIPNVFTPNGDNVNDTFFPVAKAVDVLKIEIWTRWGKSVYQNAAAWDGKISGQDAPSDVYAYQIRIRHSNGKEETFSGTTTLLR